MGDLESFAEVCGSLTLFLHMRVQLSRRRSGSAARVCFEGMLCGLCVTSVCILVIGKNVLISIARNGCCSFLWRCFKLNTWLEGCAQIVVSSKVMRGRLSGCVS